MFMECGNPICSQPGRYACKVCADAAYCSLGCRSLCWEYHQECCKPRLLPNYVVRFHLGADDIADPPIVRTLSCPATATFYDLHVALQCAFGWAFTHFFDFTVLNPAFRPPADKVRLYRDKLKAHSAGVQVDSSLPQEFLLRIVNFAKWVPFSAFDSAHEPYRRHPNTREEDADDFMLFMLFDDPAYQGRTSSSLSLSFFRR
ncbi:hypothetical protein GGS23DRAFT_571043 [Durotheca rogersii]|uniref:uncharacterized protein n=1 Tax=Durotheca rogersii TaxID=419775 RepID=UPI0022209C2D|nr:uncharacterized protein GGS23DRAFT_571043 [Durotheca rogersii]KAI5862624.1 hypothetical protein GGS23DRAFT_571043 [Durotheca rogersii]